MHSFTAKDLKELLNSRLLLNKTRPFPDNPVFMMTPQTYGIVREELEKTRIPVWQTNYKVILWGEERFLDVGECLLVNRNFIKEIDPTGWKKEQELLEAKNGT